MFYSNQCNKNPSCKSVQKWKSVFILSLSGWGFVTAKTKSEWSSRCWAAVAVKSRDFCMKPLRSSLWHDLSFLLLYHMTIFLLLVCCDLCIWNRDFHTDFLFFFFSLVIISVLQRIQQQSISWKILSWLLLSTCLNVLEEYNL